MKKFKKVIYLGLLGIFMLSAVACSKKAGTGATESTKAAGDKVDNSKFNEVVVSVGDQNIKYSEAMIYVKLIQSQYENYYGPDIWTYDLGGQTFGDMVKKEIMNMMTQTKIIGKHANDYKVTITEDDETQIKQNATQLITGLSDEDKAKYGITEELAQQFYRDNKIYEKVYDAATMDVNTDVTDAEAKQVKIQHILIATQKTDASGKKVDFTEKEKADALKKAKDLLAQAKKTDDFKKLAEANTEDPGGVEYTFGTGEMDPAFEKAAFALKKGEISDIVETSYGYHILYCVSDFDEDATQAKKEEIIAKRQDEAFQKIYKTWEPGFEVKVNDKVWDAITFESTKTTTESTGASTGSSAAATTAATTATTAATTETTAAPKK